MEVGHDHKGVYILIDADRQEERHPIMIRQLAKFFGGVTIPNRKFKDRGFVRVAVVGTLWRVSKRVCWSPMPIDLGRKLEEFVDWEIFQNFGPLD